MEAVKPYELATEQTRLLLPAPRAEQPSIKYPQITRFPTMTDTAPQPIVDRDATLGELVRAKPGAAAVLDRLGLDFCCHGDQTLAEACAAAGANLPEAIAAITATAPAAGDQDWAHLAAGPLSEHIQAVHHRYLDEELPALVSLAAKVAGVHAACHPELAEVNGLVEDLRADLVPHLAKEDRVLFPAIRTLAAGPASFGFGSIGNPIRIMTAEHETVGDLLRRLRAATSGYQVPADGCASYRLLYQRLEHLEADTHLHVFKENSVLFPLAQELEAYGASDR
jgi:regulator of cell morphogenesis and NO signaling